MADEARPGDAGGQGSGTPGGEVVKPFELDEAPAPPHRCLRLRQGVLGVGLQNLRWRARV